MFTASLLLWLLLCEKLEPVERPICFEVFKLNDGFGSDGLEDK